MRAWVFQDHRQKKKLGDKAPWSAGWVDPEGKRRSKVIGSKSRAEKYGRKKEGELAAGLCQVGPQQVSWQKFRKEYEEKILGDLKPRSRWEVIHSLDIFERLSKPQKVSAIKTSTIDGFRVKRRAEKGKKPGSLVSPYTLKKDLTALRAALNVAREWGYLEKMPKFRKVKVPEAMPRPITQEDFEAVYKACKVATMPEGLSCTPSDWWKAILVFAITTGWRKEEILLFRRDDLDLETGAVLTRAENNKGGRDDHDYLPDATMQHLRQIVGVHPMGQHREKRMRLCASSCGIER